MKCFVAILALAGIAAASPIPDDTAPARQPAPQPNQEYQEYPSAPAAYTYSWAVKDDYSNNNYGQEETRNDAVTSGSYYVFLPDGRTQKVTYSVDGYGGYQAEVTYEGTASYPESAPYKPATPAYKPSPAPSFETSPTPAYEASPAPPTYKFL